MSTENLPFRESARQSEEGQGSTRKEMDPDLVFDTAELLHKLSAKYLSCQHAWILGPRISCYADYPGLVKSCCAKLLKEGAAFLCTGDSGKPAARIFEDLGRERFP